ncbi:MULTISPECIES: CapA family protein [unclassified Streptomyces]|uniref:CapA family protein n=1 Tax=unclassified Streptomyces TaxID=2593676 RepID=UPI0037FEE761
MHEPQSRHAALPGRQRRRRHTTLGAAMIVVVAAATAYLVSRPGEAPTDNAAPPQLKSSALPRTSATAPPARHREPGTVTLAFAGDVHFTQRTAPRLDADPALGPLSPVLSAADFAMVNLESAITTRGTPEPKLYHFRTPPRALDALRRSGIDAVTMANNHAVDYGPEGLADTLSAAHDSPIPVLGIGANDTEAYRPYVTEVNGVRLAVLAASQIQDLTNATFRAGPERPGIASALDRSRLVSAVRAARARADVVVVYLHWGTEGQSCPGPEQRSIAADLSAAGATAVVGTHAHVMLGSGMLGPTYVAYGLGNFLWYGSSPYPHSDETGVTTLTVTHGSVTAADFTPALVDGHGVPEPRTGAAAQSISDRYEQLRQCTGLTPAPRQQGR